MCRLRFVFDQLVRGRLSVQQGLGRRPILKGGGARKARQKEDRCACQIFVLKSPQCLHFCSEGLTGLSTSELES